MALINGKTVELGDATIAGDQTVTGDQSIGGDLELTGGGTIRTTANGDLILLPHGTGITKIGDAGACTLGTPTNDDACVTGRLQVLGASDLIGVVGVTGTLSTDNITITANRALATSATNYGGFYGRLSGQTVDCSAISTGTVPNYYLIIQSSDIGFDHGHAQQATPTEYGHSSRQSQVEYWGKTHDTSGVVNITGHGPHTFTTAAQKARGTMTVAGLPVADETFVIDGQTITFKADGSGNVDHCTIGTDAADQVLELVSTLAECTNHADFTAWDGAGDTVVIEWGTGGVAGNAIVFTEAATNMAVDGGGTLGGTHAAVDAATLFTIGEDGSIDIATAIKIEHSTDEINTIDTGSHVTRHTAPTEIADDGTFNLPTSSAGWIRFMIGNNEEYGIAHWNAAGTVVLGDVSGNVVNTDTDAKFCVISGANPVVVKNRLAAAKKITFDYHYTTP